MRKHTQVVPPNLHCKVRVRLKVKARIRFRDMARLKVCEPKI